jgi:hypothetical protein
MDWLVELAEKERAELEEEKVGLEKFLKQHWKKVHAVERRIELVKCVQGIRGEKG